MWPNVADRIARTWLLAGALAAGVASLAGCGERTATQGIGTPVAQAAAAVVPAGAADSAELELGRKVYNFRCYFCHGYSGDAKTLATTYLSPKPRDFKNTPLAALPRDAMLIAVRDGRAGTAMKGFTGILTPSEIAAVTDFVRHEFMEKRAENTRYHTAENGWPDHERNRIAFPFARGDIAIDTAWERLDAQQQRGKRLFLSSCISCHDHGRVEQPGAVWESRAISYPRDAYCTSCHQDTPRSAPTGAAHPQRPATHTFSEPDGKVPVRAPSSDNARLAEGYLVHDRRPAMRNPTALELRGEDLFQKNCAFCHAADGTSKSWIGSFLEPHPRDLTSAQEMRGMTKERLERSIAEGLPGTSMPAWKSVLGAGDIHALMAYISRAFHPVDGVRGS
jgi:cytochrome c oxidase cbb3-type subunit III